MPLLQKDSSIFHQILGFKEMIKFQKHRRDKIITVSPSMIVVNWFTKHPHTKNTYQPSCNLFLYLAVVVIAVVAHPHPLSLSLSLHLKIFFFSCFRRGGIY